MRSLYLILISLLCQMATVQAEPEETASETAQICLSFDSALRLGATNSAAIGEEQARLAEAKANLGITKSSRLPQISAYGRTATSGGSGLLDGRTDDQLGLEATQRVFDFGKSRLELDAAKARLNAAGYAVENSHNDSYFETAFRFIEVLEAHERVEAARRVSDNFNAIVSSLPRRLELQVLTRAEASSIRAEQAVASADLIVEQLSLEMAQSELFVLTGSAAPICTVLPNALLKLVSDETSEELESWVFSALEYHPDLQALEQQRQASDAELLRQKKEQLPTLSLSGVVAYVYESDRERWEQDERLGLSLTTPLWGGGRYSNQRAQAVARKRLAEQSFDRARRDLHADMIVTLRRVLSGFGLSAARSEAVQNLDIEVAAITQEFENKLRPYQDVEAAQADLQTARLQEIEAKYDLLFYQIKLLYLTQRLRPERCCETADQ